MAPAGFSWIDRPHLAACARPDGPDNLSWLRQNGVQILVTLSEYPLRRAWIDETGLLAVHVPVADMEAPTQAQLDRCVSVIRRAREQTMGVAVHCTAGLGRTGTVLAAYLVAQGLTPRAAIERVRDLRPGSIETTEQEQAVEEFARRRAEAVSA